MAADLDALSTLFGGSQEKQVSPLASLIVRIEDRVPLGSRHDRVGVLFSFIKLKTLSSPALLCGMHNISIASLKRLENLFEPSTLQIVAMWPQIRSILLCSVPISFSAMIASFQTCCGI